MALRVEGLWGGTSVGEIVQRYLDEHPDLRLVHLMQVPLEISGAIEAYFLCTFAEVNDVLVLDPWEFPAVYPPQIDVPVPP